MTGSLSENLNELYKKYQKKYELPNFSDLVENFDITEIDSENKLLLQLMKKMLYKIESIGKIVYNLLMPDTELFSMMESNYLGPIIHKELFQMYKQLRLLIIRCYELELGSTDKKIATHIIIMYDNWIYIRKELKKVYSKLYNYWDKEDIYQAFKSINNDHLFG